MNKVPGSAFPRDRGEREHRGVKGKIMEETKRKDYSKASHRRRE